MDYKKLGKIFKEFKKHHKLTNEDVALSTGITKRLVNAFSSGRIGDDVGGEKYSPESEYVLEKAHELESFILQYGTGDPIKDEEDRCSKLDEKIAKLQEEQIKLQDERTANRKIDRANTRLLTRLNYLEKSLNDTGRIEFQIITPKNEENDNELIIMLSDWHIGQHFKSRWGQYNSEVARDRVNQLYNEVIKVADLFKINKCYVTIQGDMISGSIHKSLAITNSENVIDQIKIVSELITNFIAKIAERFSEVNIIDVTGNHTRIDRKEDALKDERLDSLITFYINAKLGHISHINFIQDDYDDNTIAMFNAKGKDYIIVHGDYDKINIQSKVDSLCKFVNKFPYAILAGHLHHPVYREMNGTKIIQSGSLAGAGDDYSIEHRIIGKPSQTLLICNDKGILYHYPVELD